MTDLRRDGFRDKGMGRQEEDKMKGMEEEGNKGEKEFRFGAGEKKDSDYKIE